MEFSDESEDFYSGSTTPQQNNCDDCGVFMLKTAECLSRGDVERGILAFSHMDMENIRYCMAYEIITQRLLIQ